MKIRRPFVWLSVPMAGSLLVAHPIAPDASQGVPVLSQQTAAITPFLVWFSWRSPTEKWAVLKALHAAPSGPWSSPRDVRTNFSAFSDRGTPTADSKIPFLGRLGKPRRATQRQDRVQWRYPVRDARRPLPSAGALQKALEPVIEPTQRLLDELLAVEPPLPVDVDLIVVFGSDLLQASVRAAELYHYYARRALQQGRPAPRIYVTGGKGGSTPSSWHFGEAREHRKVLLDGGVPAQAIVLENKASDTAKNARAVSHYLRRLPQGERLRIRSVLLIQSPPSAQRAVATLRKWAPKSVKTIHSALPFKPVVRLADLSTQERLAETTAGELGRLLVYPGEGYFAFPRERISDQNLLDGWAIVQQLLDHPDIVLRQDTQKDLERWRDAIRDELERRSIEIPVDPNAAERPRYLSPHPMATVFEFLAQQAAALSLQDMIPHLRRQDGEPVAGQTLRSVLNDLETLRLIFKPKGGHKAVYRIRERLLVEPILAVLRAYPLCRLALIDVDQLVETFEHLRIHIPSPTRNPWLYPFHNRHLDVAA